MKYIRTTILLVTVIECGVTTAGTAVQVNPLAGLVTWTINAIDDFTLQQADVHPPRPRPVVQVPAAKRFEDKLAFVAGIQAPEESLETRVNARGKRLEAYSAAFADWAARVCDLSSEERVALNESLAQQQAKLQERWQRNTHRHKTQMSDYAPVSFTSIGGAGNYLSRKQLEPLLREALTDDHREVLMAAFDKRLDEIRSAMLDDAVRMIDNELFLSVNQRQHLTMKLRSSLENVEDGVFTFNPREYYLPHSSLIHALHVLPDSDLTDVQWQRLNDVFNNSASDDRPLMFSLMAPESWPEQVDAASAGIKSMYIRSARMRIEWLAETLNLSPEQEQHLTIAATGASIQCAAAWKQRANEQLKQWKDQQGGQIAGRFLQFSIRVPSDDEFDRNQLWQHSLSKLGAADAIRIREEFHQSVRERYLVAMLDKELWLTEEQREPLAAMVASTLSTFGQNETDSYKEIRLLTIPLAGIANDKLADLLTEAQQTAWKTLQSQFQIIGDVVVMKMQNGHPAEFVLPPKPQSR